MINAHVLTRCSTPLLVLAMAAAFPLSAATGQSVAAGANVPVTTRELVQLAELEGLSVSADGGHVIVRVDRQNVDDNSTRIEWRVLRTRDAKVVAVVDAGATRWGVNGGIAPEGAQWSPDGQTFYYRKLTGETLQLWRAARDGSGVTQVTDDAADVAAFIVDESGAVHYAVGPASRAEIKAAEKAEYDDGVLLDESLISGYRVTHNFPSNGRMATYRFSSEAKWFGRAQLLGEMPLRAKTITAEGRIVAADPAIARRFDELWAATGGTIMVVDPSESSRTRYAPLDRRAQVGRGQNDDRPVKTIISAGRYVSWTDAKGIETKCSHPVCKDIDDVSVIGWAGKGTELIFQTETLGSSLLNSWNVRTQSVRVIYRQPGVLGSSGSGRLGQCMLAGSEAICIAASADNPPKLVAIDLKRGDLRTLFDPNPNLTNNRLGVARRVDVRDREGNTTWAMLVLPHDRRPNQRLPLVISSYTCSGFLQGGSGQDVPEHVFAGAGYAAACLDTSASAVRRVKGFTFEGDRVDASALGQSEELVRILDEEGIIDVQRVMLTGFSGSTVSTTYAITHSRKFTAAAVMTGGWGDVIHCYLVSSVHSCGPRWRVGKEAGQSLPYDVRGSKVLKDSPAWNVEQITAPLLMQLPEAEYTWMFQLYGAMLDYGRAVEMQIFPDAYHYKNQPRHRLSVYNRNFDWAEFWLRGKESPDPRRTDQNARWTRMRIEQCKLFTGEKALSDQPWYCKSSALRDR